MGRKTSIKPSNNNIGTERTVSYPVHEFDNYFKEDYAIIMNPVPYLKRIIFDIPRRVVGNSIILITKGTAHAKFNFKDYPIKAGDILMVPDDNILSIDKFSNDVTPWMVSGNFRHNLHAPFPRRVQSSGEILHLDAYHSVQTHLWTR